VVAPARARVDEELPPDEELREEAKVALRAVMDDPHADARAVVAAAKAILEETAPDVREHILKLMKGDKAKYIDWLRAELGAMTGEACTPSTPSS
jgi:hypothetical protein